MSSIEETKEFALVQAVCGKIKDMVKGGNTIMAPTYMRDFLVGLDVAGELYSLAVSEDIQAGKALDLAKSIAYFDFAPEYLKAQDVKVSDAAKKTAVSLCPEVQAAANIKSKTEAMTIFLRNKLQVLRVAHDDIKKIAYTEQTS